MEIFVIDDASPNDSRDLSKDSAGGRVDLPSECNNVGQHKTTNFGIDKSRGRWIHILHDDDWVMPGFYATMRRGVEMAPQSVGVAFCMYAKLERAAPFLVVAGAFPEWCGPHGPELSGPASVATR